jgi:Condensation domain
MENRTPTKSGAGGQLQRPAYQFPATLAQQAFWFLEHVEDPGSMWNIAVRFRLKGRLDGARLEKAVQLVAHRHEALRTAFKVVDDDLAQIVHEEVFIPMTVTDLSGVEAGERDSREEAITLKEGKERFDLGRGPLLRTHLLRFSAEHHMLLVTVHHIVADGWSIGVISDDIVAYYDALGQSPQPGLPDLPLQFGDYAVAEQQRQRDASLRNDRRWWREKLDQLNPCEIPPDFVPPANRSHAGHILSQLLPKKWTDVMEQVAHRHGATLFMFSMACLKLLIHSYTGNTDLYVGTLLAGRDQIELEPLVGVFVNTVVVRSRLDPAATFSQFLNVESAEVMEAVGRQHVPFSQVMAGIRTRHSSSRSHFYNVNFIFQRDFVSPREFDGIQLTPEPSRSPGAIYDLNFFMVRRSDGWRLSCEYDCELYRPESIRRMLDTLQEIFVQASMRPHEVIANLLPSGIASIPARQ